MLDKTRPYGEVWGECPFRFTQDGKLYRFDGTEVDKNGEPLKLKDRPENKKRAGK